MPTQDTNDEAIHSEAPKSKPRLNRFFLYISNHIRQLFLIVFVLAFANNFLFQQAKNFGWSDSRLYAKAMFAMDFDAADHLWTLNSGDVVEINPNGSVRTYPLPDECERADFIETPALEEVWIGGDTCLQSFNPQEEPTVWTDHQAPAMKGKDIVGLTIDEVGRVWVMAKQENPQNRFEDNVFLYNSSGGKWSQFRPVSASAAFKNPTSLVAVPKGKICFSHLYGMICRRAGGSWEKSILFWGDIYKFVADGENRLWGLSRNELTVCEESECTTYNIDNSGLKQRASSMALDSSNRLWISSYYGSGSYGLRILDGDKILPASILEYFITINFVINYLLLAGVYILVISIIDRGRNNIPPEITVRYALGKLWVSWIVISIIFIAAALYINWNAPHAVERFAGIFLAIILIPILRLLSLGVGSKIPIKTYVLTVLLSTIAFIVIGGLPTAILLVFIIMQ